MNSRRWIMKVAFLACFFLLLLLGGVSSPVSRAAEESGGGWAGVDEAVVEKVAVEHGREARTPLINTDQGDLLLFVFLLAGAIGGFVGGYYWRKLLEGRTGNTEGT